MNLDPWSPLISAASSRLFLASKLLPLPTKLLSQAAQVCGSLLIIGSKCHNCSLQLDQCHHKSRATKSNPLDMQPTKLMTSTIMLLYCEPPSHSQLVLILWQCPLFNEMKTPHILTWWDSQDDLLSEGTVWMHYGANKNWKIRSNIIGRGHRRNTTSTVLEYYLKC